MGANVSILSAAKYFFQTMSTYIPLESQLNADESFLGNYGGQSGSKGSKSNFLEGIVFFSGHILTYILLGPQFNVEQSLLRNHDLKMFGFRDVGGKSKRWRYHISNGCSYFSKYVNLCTVNFTPIKVFLGQRCTVLVKEGGHTLQFQQPHT